jgi:hypothetical protein
MNMKMIKPNRIVIALLLFFASLLPAAAQDDLSEGAVNLLTGHVLSSTEVGNLVELTPGDAPYLVDKLVRDRGNMEFLYYELHKLAPESARLKQARQELDMLGVELENARLSGASDAQTVRAHRPILEQAYSAWAPLQEVYLANEDSWEARYGQFEVLPTGRDDLRFVKIYGRCRPYYHRLNGTLSNLLID